MRTKKSMSVPAQSVYLFGFYMIFEAMVWLNAAPRVLVLFGIMELLGAGWTYAALQRNEQPARN